MHSSDAVMGTVLGATMGFAAGLILLALFALRRNRAYRNKRGKHNSTGTRLHVEWDWKSSS